MDQDKVQYVKEPYKRFLENKIRENFDFTEKRLQHVGIILNIGEFKDYDKLRDIFKNYGINENKIKFIAFLSENDTKLNHWDSYFESKDFGWNGLINNLDLQEFIEMEFDALISYYKKDNIELNYATACSRANFKIGLSNHNQNLNDIIIDINPNFIDIFGKELEKYLTGLNKIG